MRLKLLRASVLTAIASASLSHAHAADTQSMEELRNTVINLLDGLVQKGVLTREQAQAMVADAQTKAAEQAKAKAAQDAAEKDAVRVTYVPEPVREQIRNEMRDEVTTDITNEVLATAKKEGWGVPGALPDWARNVRLYGDVRARYQMEYYAEDNVEETYLNINAINGGVGFDDPDVFLNTTQDRRRFVGRLRAGLAAQLGNDFALDFRFASGNTSSPVSTNQTLGNYNRRWTVAVDKAAILWNPINAAHTQEFDFRIGRFNNPFVGINELIWDNDLTFEGVAATYALDLFGRDAKKMERGVFITVGAFPLQEVELSTDDKWLYGAQLGAEFSVGSESRLRIAGGYFEYDNITGVRNSVVGSDETDFTAPAFVQKGNTMFNIRANDQIDDSVVFGLAGRYRIANANLWLDVGFGSTHVMFGGEYVKNLGWDGQEVLARTAGVVEPYRLPEDITAERTEGYEVGVVVGDSQVNDFGKWRTSMFYKYVEQDAVLDAFTDSDFHLGGTDAKGYQVALDFGLSRGAWLRFRYLTADEIDGLALSVGKIKLGIDVLQLDLNGQF